MKRLQLQGEGTEKDVETVAAAIRAGGVVIVPTDTVYGIVCDGKNRQAKEEIFRLKRRSPEKVLVGFVGSIRGAGEYVSLSPRRK